MKLVYSDPRPYWVSESVTAYACSGSFGNPSGHSSTVACMFMTNWLELFRSFKVDYWSKVLTLVLGLTFVGTIAYSRLFLGVHSVDQILFGCFIGFWCGYTMHFCVQPFFVTEF